MTFLVHGESRQFKRLLTKQERANLSGDIPTLFLVAIVLWVLMPKKTEWGCAILH
jgi:hypothetical protein